MATTIGPVPPPLQIAAFLGLASRHCSRPPLRSPHFAASSSLGSIRGPGPAYRRPSALICPASRSKVVSDCLFQINRGLRVAGRRLPRQRVLWSDCRRSWPASRSFSRDLLSSDLRRFLSVERRPPASCVQLQLHRSAGRGQPPWHQVPPTGFASMSDCLP